MRNPKNTEIVVGEIAALTTHLGMIAVALREERTRRFILPLAAPALIVWRALAAAAARGDTVALRVRGASLVEIVAAEEALPRAA